MKRIPWSTMLTRWIGAAFSLGVTLAALVAFDGIWIDYLWYRSLDQASIFAVRLASQAVVLLAATAVGMLVLLPSGRSAWRIAGGRPRFNTLTTLSCLFLAGATAWNLSTQWMTFRLAVAQAPFGLTEPQFGLDVGFFVFTLPAFELLFSWLSGLLILAIVVVIFIVFVSSRLSTTGEIAARWWQLKQLLSVLVGGLMLTVAFNFQLAVWRLVYSSRTPFAGASAADVIAQLPAFWILAAISAGVGITLILSAGRRSFRPTFMAFGLWLAAAVVLGTAWPAAVQAFVVAPNEVTAEAPYIERNISMTREAFDLTSVSANAYPALESITASAAAAAEQGLGDATVWTPAAVKQAFNQLETIRPYYRLSPIQFDRYRVDGKQMQMLVAARQIDTGGLPSQAHTWVNTHLVYTHGYGLAMSSASTTTAEGFPEFVVGGVPPRVVSDVASASPELALDEPRIYFGADDSEYAIVDTGIDEFDYPLGEKNVTYRYAADGGISVGTWPRRLAWAVRLRSDELLFSDYVERDSRVLLYRGAKERAAKLAPWMEYSKPYAAIVDGRILWIMDAYTSSDHFPYSQPLADGTNYLRNSVKVTVDALSGETVFYASGDDPVRDAWSHIFPRLITPEREMPASVAEHIRVPKRLFSAQAQVYRTYHMTDAVTFYNKEDLWQIPLDRSGEAIGSAYVMLDLPDPTTGASTGKAMYLLQPYSLPGKDNLVGWLATACGSESYGRKTAYLLPKDRVTLGQQQVTARINQDPKISQQLTLWNQPGSSLVFGDMLVLPAEGTVAYVQPLFLKARNSAITELVSVIAVAGDSVEIGATLEDALHKTYGSGSASATAGDDGS